MHGDKEVDTPNARRKRKLAFHNPVPSRVIGKGRLSGSILDHHPQELQERKGCRVADVDYVWSTLMEKGARLTIRSRPVGSCSILV
jgi:hypothetical protein